MRCSPLLVVCSALCLGSVVAFKAEEFKTCQKSGFCNRHRDQVWIASVCALALLLLLLFFYLYKNSGEYSWVFEEK